jgi:FkbM family methyltransferase
MTKLMLNNLKKRLHNHQKLYSFLRKSKFGILVNNYRLNLEFRDFTKKNLIEINKLKDLFNDDLSIKTFEMIINKRLNKVVAQDYLKHDGSQYFCFKEVGIEFDSNEIFIDAGSFNGDTLEEFLIQTDNQFGEIHCIEPDLDNYETLNRKIIQLQFKNVYAYNLALLDQQQRMSFDFGQTASSKLTLTGSQEINVNTIDNLFMKKKVTFIKMDIEGAELKALQGAKKTIQKYHPKLAICVYHKPEDIVEIPKLISSFDSTYNFFIRHHENNFYETVLYAY